MPMNKKIPHDWIDLIKKFQDLGDEKVEVTEEQAKQLLSRSAIAKENEAKNRSEGKKRFEIRALRDIESQEILLQKAIFIDGEHFDWDVDHEALAWAERQGPVFFAAVQKDINNHFLACLSEVVGREIRMVDFQNAMKTGWI